MNLLLSTSSWYLNRRVIILNVISLLVIEFSYVEHLVVDGLIAVIYLLSNTISASIFLVRFRIFGSLDEPGGNFGFFHKAIVDVLLDIIRIDLKIFPFKAIPFLIHLVELLILFVTAFDVLIDHFIIQNFFVFIVFVVFSCFKKNIFDFFSSFCFAAV